MLRLLVSRVPLGLLVVLAVLGSLSVGLLAPIVPVLISRPVLPLSLILGPRLVAVSPLLIVSR